MSRENAQHKFMEKKSQHQINNNKKIIEINYWAVREER